MPFEYKSIPDEDEYGIIKIPTSLEKKSERDFKNLRLVQDFQGHQEPILAAEFSHNSEYLATGCNKGLLKIWKILGPEYDEEPYSLLENTPY